MYDVAILFPGQGAQFAGMGRELMNEHTIANDVFLEANDILGIDIKKICLDKDASQLVQTSITQPALLTYGVAAYKVYMDKIGIEPTYMAGHSLGEITALTCAEAIGFADALKIVRKRGLFMQEAAKENFGAMLAINGIDREVVEKKILEWSHNKDVVISNYNSAQQIVISGEKDATHQMGEKFREMGARVIPLKVSAPFHSPFMLPASKRLQEELSQYTFNRPRYQVISNIDGRVYKGKDKIIDNLTKQMVMPVRWYDSMMLLQKKKMKKIIDIGPGSIVKNIMERISPEIKSYAFDKQIDYLGLETWRSNIYTIIDVCNAIAVSTKNTNWDEKAYKKGVIEPYQKIQKMQYHLEENGQLPTRKQMEEALILLNTILNTKKVSESRKKHVFQQAFEETETEDLFKDFIMN